MPSPIPVSLLSDDANKATVPLLDAAEFGYQTTFQEKLLAVQEDVTQMEFTGSGLVRTGGVAVSMPVGVAGRYRVSSGSVRSRRAWQAVAKGRLLITDRAIIFDGDGLRERITWGKVSEIETRVDGYEVIKLGVNQQKSLCFGTMRGLSGSMWDKPRFSGDLRGFPASFRAWSGLT